MRICAVIPVYNEAQTIGYIVENLKKKGIDAVVIDDGSDDHSGSIAQEKGAEVIRHAQKKGKGLSLRDGFDYAIKNKYEAVIAMDGDGQHDVNDIDTFISEAGTRNACVITGTRMGNYRGMPLIRVIVNKAMSAIISAICKQKIPDTQCGYRFISSDVLRSVALSSSDFEIESEVLIQASRKGFKIYSVPVKTIYRNESSKINPFLDTVRFFVFIAKAMRTTKS